jgi:hypothetical protein
MRPGRLSQAQTAHKHNKILGGLTMYLIGIKKGVHPCGNAGTLKSHYKAEYKLRETAQRFATMHALDEVYGLQLYPQKLCEMDNTELVNYMRRNGKQYV